MPITAGVFVSAVAFPVFLATLQRRVWSPLRVSSNQRLLANVCGLISVCCAGVGSTVVLKSTAELTCLYTRNKKDFNVLITNTQAWLLEKMRFIGNVTPDNLSIILEQFKYDALGMLPNGPFVLCNDYHRVCAFARICILKYPDFIVNATCSALVFKALGGKFKSVMPSDLFYPGAFGFTKGSLQAKGSEYASSAQKALLDTFGKKYGYYVLKHILHYMYNHIHIKLYTIMFIYIHIFIQLYS